MADIIMLSDSLHNSCVKSREVTIWPGIVAHCMRKLSDKEAWKIGQFLWNEPPDNDTTDRQRTFFDYRREVYAELDKRKICHPILEKEVNNV